MRAAAFAWFCVALALPSGDLSPDPRFTILFFTAPWCGPCRAVQPILDRFARKNVKTVRVIEVNFDRGEAEAERWGVEDIPVVIVLSDQGELLLRANGASRQTLSALKSGWRNLSTSPARGAPHERGDADVPVRRVAGGSRRPAGAGE